MRKILICFVLFAGSVGWADDPQCTEEPREKWLKTDEMKRKAEGMGYRIKKFMTKEKCYSIKGEKDGQKVEVFFNPVDGTIFPTSASPAK